MHIAVLLAGLTGVFGKLITLNEIVLVWYRVLLSFLLLWAGLRLFKKFEHYSVAAKKKLLLSGLLPGFHWIFFYASIKYSNISVGVVCYCLTAFFTAIMAPMLKRKRLSVKELVLSCLTVAGVGLIFHFDTSFRLGIALGVVSSILAAGYFLANEKLVKDYNVYMISYYQMAGATLAVGLLLPLCSLLYASTVFTPSVPDLAYLLVLALFCTIGLYTLVGEALKKLSAFTVNLSFNLEPIYSIILAMLLFHENKLLNASFYVGLLLIVLSVVLQMLLSAKKRVYR